MTKLKIAQIGYGYWGKNTAREISSINGVHLETIFDISPERQKEAARVYPEIKHYSSIDDVLKSDVDAIMIVTPPDTHYQIAKKAFKAGKHVYCEKPLTTRLTDAYDLIELSEKKDRILFVDHVFIYS